MLEASFALMVVFSLYAFIASEWTGNWSKVDQLWSVSPVIFAWMLSEFHPRAMVVSLLITLWGTRLTYNFYRRGGYNFHDEDYRWKYVREFIPVRLHRLFNLTFVSFYQNFLLWIVCTPIHVVASGPKDLDWTDAILVVLYLQLLLMETVADQQQWIFQNFKHSLKEEERKTHPSNSIREGFLQTGLFRYCRHPAYFAEQSMWACVFAFSLRVTNGHWHWCTVGIILYVLLFAGSVRFSESITLQKYKAYKIYQQHVNQMIPWFPSKAFSSRKAE